MVPITIEENRKMEAEFTNIFNKIFRSVQRDGDKSRILKSEIENRHKARPRCTTDKIRTSGLMLYITKKKQSMKPLPRT